MAAMCFCCLDARMPRKPLCLSLTATFIGRDLSHVPFKQHGHRNIWNTTSLNSLDCQCLSRSPVNRITF